MSKCLSISFAKHNLNAGVYEAHADVVRFHFIEPLTQHDAM